MLILPEGVEENLWASFPGILVERFSTLGMEIKCKLKSVISNCCTNVKINGENFNII